MISVRGATRQRKSVDALDQHIQGCVWQRAGQRMSRGQVLLGNIQCRAADRRAGCADSRAARSGYPASSYISAACRSCPSVGSVVRFTR